MLSIEDRFELSSLIHEFLRNKNIVLLENWGEYYDNHLPRSKFIKEFVDFLEYKYFHEKESGETKSL